MNSLNKRIDTIEELLSHSENDIVSKLKRIEEQKKKEKVETMNSTYQEYLHDTLINEHTKEIHKKDFLSVLICTIKYVRLNNHSISRTLGVKPSLELETECTVHFIQSVYGDAFEEDFIRSSSLVLERLLYPIQETVDIEPKKEEQKKGFKLFKTK